MRTIVEPSGTSRAPDFTCPIKLAFFASPLAEKLQSSGDWTIVMISKNAGMTH
jgi:hypothetical protein